MRKIPCVLIAIHVRQVYRSIDYYNLWHKAYVTRGKAA